jgi:hypothetical protein
VAAVNANNQYFQQLIQQGAISGKEYLQFRFDQLQTGYQNYMMSMSQTMQEWQTLESVDENQFRQVSANIQSQIDSMTDQMLSEMGGYQNQEEYLAAIKSLWGQDAIDYDEAIKQTWEDRGNSMDTWFHKNWGWAMFIPGAPIVYGVARLSAWIASLFE